jgi:hypothetical protein
MEDLVIAVIVGSVFGVIGSMIGTALLRRGSKDGHEHD